MIIVCPQNSTRFQELLFVLIGMELPCASEGHWTSPYFVFCRLLLGFRWPMPCCWVRAALSYISLCWRALLRRQKEGIPKGSSAAGHKLGLFLCHK